MTTVVAVKTKNGFIFGSDSRVSGNYYDSLRTPKFSKNGPYVIGVAGNYNALHSMFQGDLPKPPRGLENYDRFVRSTLIPAVQKIENGAGVEHGEAHYIFAFEKNVYLLDGTGFFISTVRDLVVIGSGSLFTRGYLLGITENSEGFSETDIESALRAAANNDPGTSGPFHVKRFSFDSES